MLLLCPCRASRRLRRFDAAPGSRDATICFAALMLMPYADDAAHAARHFDAMAAHVAVAADAELLMRRGLRSADDATMPALMP